jgi:putative membrane protein
MTTPEADPLEYASTELASDRTAMAIERTTLAEDRTLLAIVRTSLSLISFGFTIYQFLGKLAQSLTNNDTTIRESARNFGATLIILGVALLIAGLWAHFRGLAALRIRRGYLQARGLLRTPPIFRPTATGVVALVLLVLGVVAIFDMLVRIGPLK